MLYSVFSLLLFARIREGRYSHIRTNERMRIGEILTKKERTVGGPLLRCSVRERWLECLEEKLDCGSDRDNAHAVSQTDSCPD